MRISDWSSDVCSSDLADEADAAVDGLDVVGHRRVPGNLARELRDVHAQAIRRVQPRLDIPDVRDGIEPASLHGDRTQRVALEVGQLVAEQIGRGSCRDSVCQYEYIQGVPVSLRKQNN